ncbi:MAG: GntR family transcriptional regulator [Pseudomonadota bacterium]
MAKPKHTEVVIDAIMTRIESGQLLPGAQISEKELIDTCAVSRTPVREALIQLEADGLVVRNSRKGVSLFHPTTDQFLAILEVHATLEAQAAELAAQRISPLQADTLYATSAACDAFANAPDQKAHTGYFELNMHFHAAVAEASCNPYLVDMIKLNARKLMAHYRLRYRTPGTIETSAREHNEIMTCIQDHDSAAARKAMLAHFNYERETVMHMIASVG